MQALNILACALSVILGMLVFITPYLIEHLTAQQTLKLKQVRAEETLLKAVDLTEDLLARTESMHAELMKNMLLSKQLPSKIEEKTEELMEAISVRENEESIFLKNEIETLKALESDKLLAIVTDFRKQVGKLETIISTQKLSGGVTENHIAENVIKSLKEETGFLASSFNTDLVRLKNELISQFAGTESNRDSQDPQTEAAKEYPSEEATADEIMPLLPEDEESSYTYQENNDSVLEEGVDSTRDTLEEENFSEDEEMDEASESADDPNPLVTRKNADGLTRLLVGAFIGISNKLYIRGDGPGLNWNKGVPMELVGIGKWEWKTYDAYGKILCKVLINDEEWTDSEELMLEPHTTVETTASF